MEETLDNLKSSLRTLKKTIDLKINERQGYLNRANEIQKIYNRMYQDKVSVKEYRKSVNTFYKKNYDDFKGNNFKYTYKPAVKDLVNSYDYVIDKIDVNLDSLNNKMLTLKNQASECLGVLGILESSYNTVKTKIENWTN